LIITISGRPGSGKSVVAARVADALGLEHVSAGDFMRDMATERGLSILELSRSAEAGDEIDREIDARTARLAEERSDFVIDARLGWHFVPESMKVFLEVRPEVAAERIYEARRGSEHENVTLEETEAAIELRTESEKKRYLTYYDLDYTDHSQYDLVLDTSEKSIEQVVQEILDHADGAEGSRRSGGDVPVR
jgi:cytidylate kinase